MKEIFYAFVFMLLIVGISSYLGYIDGTTNIELSEDNSIYTSLNIIENSTTQYKTTNYYHPEIRGATVLEQEYINIILNNTNQDIVNNIEVINIYNEYDIDNICGRPSIISNDNILIVSTNGASSAGCAEIKQTTYFGVTPVFDKGVINIVNLNYYNEFHEDYVICSSFAWTLNHEIGHLNGYIIGDKSEEFAENYAHKYTNVSVIYEDVSEC